MTDMSGRAAGGTVSPGQTIPCVVRDGRVSFDDGVTWEDFAPPPLCGHCWDPGVSISTHGRMGRSRFCSLCGTFQWLEWLE